MKKEEAVVILQDIKAHLPLVAEALDLAIEALRERPAPEQMEFSKAFIEALREVVRISDRKHSAWDEVKAFLAALDAQDETPDHV